MSTRINGGFKFIIIFWPFFKNEAKISWGHSTFLLYPFEKKNLGRKQKDDILSYFPLKALNRYLLQNKHGHSNILETIKMLDTILCWTQ